MSFMGVAARLAREGVENGDGGPFGAVIVRDGIVVGAACNKVVSGKDPTAHAEMEAIRAACRTVDSFLLEGCELYTTCEPCPMCLAAMHWARLDRVYFAMTRRDAAAIGFIDAEIYEAMQVPRVPLERCENEEAAEVFALWSQKPDRVQY